MKFKYLFLALLPFSLVACQSTLPKTDAVESVQAETIEQQLTAYNWTYQNSQATQPLSLHFGTDHRLSIQTGCNAQGGTWNIEGQQLLTSSLISTMKACQDDLMKQEQWSAAVFNEAKNNIEITTASKQAVLTLTDKQGKKLVFQGDKVMNTTALTNYTWTYQPQGSPRPIVLSFSQDRLSIDTGCNRQSTSLNIRPHQFTTSALMSTQMACDAVLMKQEQLSSSIFQKRTIPFEMNLANPQQPTLTLTDAQGQSYTFAGKMTPEAQYQSQAETIFLEISPETKSCTGVAPQTCLRVREIKYNEQGVKTQVDKDWTLFYDNIEGFQHDPNQRVIVRVKRYERKTPAADQSKYVYIHDMTVEQEQLQHR